LAASTGQPKAGRGGLLRHPEFLKLWSAETISQFGTQVSQLALPLIAAVTLHVDAFQFGLLGTIEFLPFILLSLPAGVWVDRLRRRPILIAGDIGRGLALASIPVAFALNALTIWQLYVVGFTVGCLTVFFDVAYQSYLPSLVDRDEILEGNSKLEISRSGAQIAGPGIAGFVIGIVSAPIAIILDSLSYLGSAAFVFRIRKAEPPVVREVHPDGRKGPGMRTEIASGLRFVMSQPYLRSIAACTATSNLFNNIGFGILILYLVSAPLNLKAEEIGIAFSIGSIGFLLGAVLANRIGGRFGVGPTIVGSAIFYGPGFILVALAPANDPLPWVTAAIFIESLGGVVYNINQVSLRQAITPQRMQGRMNATMRFMVWGTIPIGSTLGGVLGNAIGLHTTIWIGAIGGLFSFVPLLFSPVRSLMKMPESPEEEPPGRPTQTPNERAIETLGEALDEMPRPGPGTPAPDDR
jgi:MFS family permease